MKHVLRLAIILSAAVALTACVSKPVRTPAPVDREAALREDAARAALRDWSLSGRVAISSGRQGGSGRIDWTQQGDRYELSLAAPVTRQSWRLAGDPSGARLEGIQGGPREGADVELLLLEATGWTIPVRAMVDWVRGVPAAPAVQGPAQVVLGADARPAAIEQAGWKIEYRDWHPAAEDRPALPKRIEAQRGDAKVRLVVDEWRAPAPAATATADPGTPDVQLERALKDLNLDAPAADMAANVAAGDLRPVAVCGFACLAPGFGEGGASVQAGDARILDNTGDVVMGEHHQALKRRAAAYADAYNRALRAWLDAERNAAPGSLPGRE